MRISVRVICPGVFDDPITVDENAVIQDALSAAQVSTDAKTLRLNGADAKLSDPLQEGDKIYVVPKPAGN